MNWTDTDHKKPDDEQRVLGYWPNEGGCMETLTYHASDSDVDGREGWTTAWGESADAPTHWTPMPSPPPARRGVCRTCQGTGDFYYGTGHTGPREKGCEDCGASPQPQPGLPAFTGCVRDRCAYSGECSRVARCLEADVHAGFSESKGD
jgi:hypothetical protein